MISGDSVICLCPIFIIEIKVCADHGEVQNIERCDPVERIDEFVDDAAEIADHDDDHEVGAFAVHDAGVQGFEFWISV